MLTVKFGNVFALFFLLIPIICVLVLIVYNRIFKKGIYISGIDSFKQGITPGIFAYYFCLFSFITGLFLIAFSISDPQKGIRRETITSKGIDIVISLDMSHSMLIPDYNGVQRIEVAKKHIEDFVKERKGDRIGLVTFSEQSILRCPATLNHSLLTRILKSLKIDKDKPGSTAIGLGIASAINRLSTIKDNQKSLSKIILLITDGANNTGEITPERAVEIAIKYGYKIYSIGIGNEHELDLELLQNISSQTGGIFYHAKNVKEFAGVFKDINNIEKNIIKVENYSAYNSVGYNIAFTGIILILISLFINFFYKRVS